jgi:hypothetical protein
MNKTKFAVFGMMIVAIMSQMCIDAGPSQDNTSFRVQQGIRQTTAHQRTQAASRGSSSQKNPQAEYGRGIKKHRENLNKSLQRQHGRGPCKGVRCQTAPVASSAPTASSSSYSSED